MSLKSSYKAKKLAILKEKAEIVTQRLLKEKKNKIVIERSQIHFDRANKFVNMINEGTFNKEEAKKISNAVKKLESLLSKFGGQLPQLTAMIQNVVKDLNQFRGAGWWSKLLRSMSTSSNPITKAATLESLISGGMEAVETLLDEQGAQLEDVPLKDSEHGKNTIVGLEHAFDPGRISSLSSLAGAGGNLNQLFGTKMSIGKVIAQDLSNLKPSQLRDIAKSVTALGTPPPVTDTTPQAAAQAGKTPEQGSSENQSTPSTPTTGTKGSAPAQTTASSQETQTPSSNNQQTGTAHADNGTDKTITGNLDSKTIQSKAGASMANMFNALKNNNQKGALYWAAKSLDGLGLTAKDAIAALNPKSAKTESPI